MLGASPFALAAALGACTPETPPAPAKDSVVVWAYDGAVGGQEPGIQFDHITLSFEDTEKGVEFRYRLHWKKLGEKPPVRIKLTPVCQVGDERISVRSFPAAIQRHEDRELSTLSVEIFSRQPERCQLTFEAYPSAEVGAGPQSVGVLCFEEGEARLGACESFVGSSVDKPPGDLQISLESMSSANGVVHLELVATVWGELGDERDLRVRMLCATDEGLLATSVPVFDVLTDVGPGQSRRFGADLFMETPLKKQGDCQLEVSNKATYRAAVDVDATFCSDAANAFVEGGCDFELSVPNDESAPLAISHLALLLVPSKGASGQNLEVTHLVHAQRNLRHDWVYDVRARCRGDLTPVDVAQATNLAGLRAGEASWVKVTLFLIKPLTNPPKECTLELDLREGEALLQREVHCWREGKVTAGACIE
ncbi:MAG: hypothetical protein AUK47_20135 [Deltaproteobacteria bacterium CG2_30_63_29]|nr:MAG: hypothetical protein AUK47_20135 [Deltaproteobacteria bacterium CG2_30_63_29]